LARIFDDEDHSIEEQREIIIGYLVKARRATRRERKEYEENVKS
jgi:uncharacterized DUF497 family protein